MKKVNVRKIVVTAMMSAISAVLMFLEFSVPFMPSFIKFDLSDLPALVSSFSMGPLWGTLVCLLKNVIKGIIGTNTAWVGELANFLLGAVFVIPAGLIYSRSKSRRSALIGSLVGAVSSAVISLPINYFITYPIYQKFMPIDEIVRMYQAIFGGVNSLIECLAVFNVPFTFIKCAVAAVITFLIYKRISPIIKGTH